MYATIEDVNGSLRFFREVIIAQYFVANYLGTKYYIVVVWFLWSPFYLPETNTSYLPFIIPRNILKYIYSTYEKQDKNGLNKLDPLLPSR